MYIKHPLSIITLSFALLIPYSILQADAKNFKGPFLAISIGHASGTAKAATHEPNLADREERDLGLRGASGGIHVGWQHQFEHQNFILGAEVSANLSNQDGKDETTSMNRLVENKLEQRDSYIFGVRLGKVVDNTLAYIHLGFAVANWELKTEFSQAAGATHSQRSRRYMLGFAPGVGLETKITDRINLGAHFTYMHFPRTLTNRDDPNITQVSSSTRRHHFNDFRVRLSWQIFA